MKTQILTLEIAKNLIGKKITLNSIVYKSNNKISNVVTILGIESEWDLAKKEDFSIQSNGKFATRQDYWKSYFTDDKIKQSQNKMSLICDEEVYVYSYDGENFTCGDSDRYVIFEIVDDASFKVEIECHNERIVFDALNINKHEKEIKDFIRNNCLNNCANITYKEINSVTLIDSAIVCGEILHGYKKYFSFKDKCFYSDVAKGTKKIFTRCRYIHEFDYKTDELGYTDKDLSVNYHFDLLVKYFNSDYEN